MSREKSSPSARKISLTVFLTSLFSFFQCYFSRN
uniref:Uncharacterized protein n=1 Tax=Rhizophora mucronata TaxID=61149 RepID=A0A2P2IM61_RHIMU